MTVATPPAPVRHTDPATPRRLRLVLATIALSVVWVVFVADKPWSDGRTAAALTAAQNVLFLIHNNAAQRY